MKIVAVCQCLDLSEKELGITPAWWQILKGLHELGVEVVAVPYYGKSVTSLWWNAYENPNLWKNKAYNLIEGLAKSLFNDRMSFRQRNQKIIDVMVKNFVKTKWEKSLKSLIQNEKDVSAVIFLTVPLNHFVGIPKIIKHEFGIPVIFYDGDTPTSLPSYGGLSFSFYSGADPSEYDAFIINSKGASKEVKELGARRVYTLYWGVDPGLFSLIKGLEEVYDIGFFGIGDKLRENWVTQMMIEPALKLPTRNFAVCGTAFNTELKAVKYVDFNKISYRRFSSQTKINLNIVRKPHAEIYASSISRIFELASLGRCIVSNPYSGIEEWFKIGKEVMVVNDKYEVSEIYNMLLSDQDMRFDMGVAARKKVLQKHTHIHRAKQLINIIKGLT